MSTERANFIRNLVAANGGEVLFSDDQRMEIIFSFDKDGFTLSHFFNIELEPRGGRWLPAERQGVEKTEAAAWSPG